MGTYLVMKNNFRRSLKHKTLFAVTFLLPVILCIVAGSIRLGKPILRVGVLGMESNSLITEEKDVFYDILNKSEDIKYENMKEATLLTDLITGKYQVILDYRESSNKNTFQLLSYQKEDKIQIFYDTFQEAISNNNPIQIYDFESKGLTITERSISILMTLFLIFSTLQASRIIRDYQNGIVIRYQFAKRNKFGYVAGYWSYTLLFIYGQVLVCIAALNLVQKGFALNLNEIILLSVTITLIATFFAMLICLGSNSEIKSNILSSALAAVFSLLGGTFVAVEAMPRALRFLSIISPVRWIVELYRFL